MNLSANSKNWMKWLVVCWSFIEVLLFGGILFGWGSLVFVLKEEGLYADLCSKDIHVSKSDTTTAVPIAAFALSSSAMENNSSSIDRSAEEKVVFDDFPVCRAQDERLALCFAIASALFFFSSAFMGQINYRFGTRITRIIAFISFIVGSLMMAFANVDIPWLIFPGMSMVAIGGLPLIVTDVQVSNVFINGRSTFVAGLCGAFDMSAGVQLFVKLAYERGFSRQNMFLVIVGVHLMTLVSTFGLLPKMFIPALEDGESFKLTSTAEKDSTLKTKTMTVWTATESMSTVDTADLQLDERNKDSKISAGHLKCLKQPVFITHCVWYCALQLKFLYFMGSMNSYLNRILDDDKSDVSYFTNVALYIMMGGLISSFMAGMIYDWQKNKYKEGFTEKFRKIRPAILPLTLASILCLLFSALTIFKSEAMIYPVFVSMIFFRSFLYGNALAFLSEVFPSEYFGFLFGILYAIGGVVGFLQYAFFSWAEAYTNAPMHVDIVLLILVFISLCHPAYSWLTCTREQRLTRV